MTPRLQAPISGGKTSKAMTSQFTRALMSALDEGSMNYPISGIEEKLHLRFPIGSQVNIFKYGPGRSLGISYVLREPKKFSWYEFDKARFCRGFWNVAKPALFAMTGREIASCPELCTERRFGRHRVTRPAPAAGGLPRLPSTTPAAGR